ncbi:MAG: AAA family ATPase, partial [Anaerolineae bacterium]|nr:AAA family ATPase [Anaerolineae bacterium]
MYARTQAIFNFAPVETRSVKGLDYNLEVYRLISSRGKPTSERGLPGVEGIFLGRTQEISTLMRLSHTFLRDKEGSIVVIEGEAGLGKSRLVKEWLQANDSTHYRIWQGRGLPYAQGSGYGVFRSLVQDSINKLPDSKKWSEQISDTFRPFIRNLLGVPTSAEDELTQRYLSPERTNQMYILAIREWILNAAMENNLILVLDDFHWADDPSREVLKAVVKLIQTAPVLFVIITRPTSGNTAFYDDITRFNPTKITIPPLNPEDSVKLLHNIADLDNVPPEIIETILTRAEGNPFYIEEFIRMLIEKGVMTYERNRWKVTASLALERLDIPTSLRGMLMARIDRLPENLRYLLQDAAV